MKNINKSRIHLWSKYKHLLYLLYYIVIGVLYASFNEIITTRTYMYLPVIDDLIPFVKEMVIPYIIWYAYIIIPLAYFAFNDVESYTNLCIFLFVGMTICFVIFAIFPNGQNLRPSIVQGDVYSRIIQNIYNTDKPINSAPSIHTLTAIAVHFVLSTSRKLKDKKLLIKASEVLMVLIVCSTVMIKQHSIIDVIVGIALAVILNSFIYSDSFKTFVKKSSEKAMVLFEAQPNVLYDLKLVTRSMFNK